MAVSTGHASLDLTGLTDDEQFVNEAAWLNSILSANPNNEADTQNSTSSASSLSSLDSNLAQTLAALDVATHDTSALVDRTISEISRSVPRLTFDLQLMRENALLLKFTLDAVRKKSSAGTGGFGSSAGRDDASSVTSSNQIGNVMARLAVLDTVKTRMEAARDVLREAESWSTLESEVTALVNEAQFSKAAERLEEASRSMIVFQNTTEYETRRGLMVSLQNQLEASLSQSLLQAIQQTDLKKCKTFFAIFQQIQRQAEFTNYYFTTRRKILVDSWIEIKLVEQGITSNDMTRTLSADRPESDPIKFIQFLQIFYNDLNSILNEEKSFIPTIFPSPVSTLSSFVCTTFECLSPSLAQRLSLVSDFYNALALPELISAYQTTEEFALRVEAILHQMDTSINSGTTGAPAASPSTPNSKRDRRLSQRMSVSRRTQSRSSFGGSAQTPFDPSELNLTASHAQADSLRDWEISLFEPFLDYQTEFNLLEDSNLAKQISQQIEKLAGNRDTNFMQSLVTGAGEKRGARTLSDLVNHIFALFEVSIARCFSFTHGYGALGLLQTLEKVWLDFISSRTQELKRLNYSDQESTNTKSLSEPNDFALEGLEYSSHDWQSFQFGLSLLEISRSITNKFESFQSKLQNKLTVFAHTVHEARSSASGHIVPGTTAGAITLLRQSSLNSAELTNLLDTLQANSSAANPSTNTTAGYFPTNTSQTSLPHQINLLPKSRTATIEFTRATQTFLHSILLLPLLNHLTGYATLPAWTAGGLGGGGGTTKGAFDLTIPSFSLSPTETISRVGEGLFNLPRLFEVYAENDALGFSVETLPFIQGEQLDALRNLVQQENEQTAETAANPTSPAVRPSHRLSESSSLSITTLPAAHLGSSPPLSRPSAAHFRHASNSHFTVNAPEPPALQLSPETVISTWLTSLTLSILNHLTRQTLPAISRLSKNGVNQLISDLDYIGNVARALDVGGQGLAELEAWRETLKNVNSVGNRALNEEKVNENRVKVDQAIVDKVARMTTSRRS